MYRIMGQPCQNKVDAPLGFFDTFVLWADLGVSFWVMVVGMFLVPGLGLGQALVAILVGALIGNGLLCLIATIGSNTGMPTMALCRPVLELRGSYAPSILNILQLIGWVAFEISMAQAAHLLSERFLDGSSYLAWVVFRSHYYPHGDGRAGFRHQVVA